MHMPRSIIYGRWWTTAPPSTHAYLAVVHSVQAHLWAVVADAHACAAEARCMAIMVELRALQVSIKQQTQMRAVLCSHCPDKQQGIHQPAAQ